MTKERKRGDLRVNRHIDDLSRLYELLQEIDNGNIRNEEVIFSCSTQGGLARLNLPDKKIKPMSLNTLKATAKEHPSYSWESLEKLRKKVASLSSSRKKDQPHVSRRSIEEDLQNKLDEAYRIRAVLYKAYGHLLELADSQTHLDEAFARHVEQHKLLFSTDFGLRIVSNEEQQ